MYQLKKTEVTCICDNVYVLTDRAGCCVNLVVGKEKALVFDTGSGTDDIHGLVRKMTGLPLVVINSHGHFDHIGGNSQFDTVYMHQDDFVILESYTAELLGQWDNMKALDFDYYLTSHHSQCFPRQTIDRLMRCIENSPEGKWHPYQYPYPPYAKGKIYLDSMEGEPVALLDVSAVLWEASDTERLPKQKCSRNELSLKIDISADICYT